MMNRDHDEHLRDPDEYMGDDLKGVGGAFVLLLLMFMIILDIICAFFKNIYTHLRG